MRLADHPGSGSVDGRRYSEESGSQLSTNEVNFSSHLRLFVVENMLVLLDQIKPAYTIATYVALSRRLSLLPRNGPP